MQFLRTVFWVVLAVVGVIFATANWTPVTVNLWSGMVVDTRLPVLMLVTFLLGLVPMLIVHRATRWTLRRRLDNANRALTETAVLPSTVRDVPPPGATPFAPPPGVA
jgi:lipopolysaccharide assembly protein A